MHEVYCNAAGQPDDHVRLGADADEGLAGIIDALEMALQDARERPVLAYAQFGTPEQGRP